MGKGLLTKSYARLKKLLENHDRIAVDIDNTLIGKNINKFVIWKYIVEYSREKHFYLVTFREEYQIETVFDEMKNEGFNFDFSRLFKKLIYFPEDKNNYRNALIPYWKGMVCRENNLTCLIDDDILLTKDGAVKYGIVLIDSKTIRRVV